MKKIITSILLSMLFSYSALAELASEQQIARHKAIVPYAKSASDSAQPPFRIPAKSPLPKDQCYLGEMFSLLSMYIAVTGKWYEATARLPLANNIADTSLLDYFLTPGPETLLKNTGKEISERARYIQSRTAIINETAQRMQSRKEWNAARAEGKYKKAMNIEREIFKAQQRIDRHKKKMADLEEVSNKRAEALGYKREHGVFSGRTELNTYTLAFGRNQKVMRDWVLNLQPQAFGALLLTLSDDTQAFSIKNIWEIKSLNNDEVYLLQQQAIELAIHWISEEPDAIKRFEEAVITMGGDGMRPRHARLTYCKNKSRLDLFMEKRKNEFREHNEHIQTEYKALISKLGGRLNSHCNQQTISKEPAFAPTQGVKTEHKGPNID